MICFASTAREGNLGRMNQLKLKISRTLNIGSSCKSFVFVYPCHVHAGFNDDEICDFVAMTADRHVDVRFIEYMPFTGNRWDTSQMVPFRDALALIRERYPAVEALENGPNDTSKAYRVPGFRGQIGFISSMTEHFCGGCNRLRITADGNLKVCLFGNTEVSLRDALRAGCSEDDLRCLISAAVKRKKKQHAG